MPGPEHVTKSWLPGDHHDLCRKIVVPAELKWEISDKLDQANSMNGS